MYPSKLYILALGLKKKAGVTEARVDYPLRALNDLPGITTHFDSGSVKIPDLFKTQPGIFILHRQIIDDEKMRSKIEEMISCGWVIVSDIDDDPHHWRGFIDSNFYAFRAVHAVTVSTPPLADMVREWNPNVTVFRNEIFELPSLVSPTSPKNQQFSIFFGALNRLDDWKTISHEIISVAEEYPKVIWNIVHDRGVYESLPSNCNKIFYSTLNHNEYLKILASSDVSLLPLNNTKFNTHKSDLKLIESLACQTVAICSPIVYAQNPIHFEIARFAFHPEDWRNHLKFFIENPDSLCGFRKKGLAYVRNERTHSINAPSRAKYYRELLSLRDHLELQRQERVRRV
jgi:hypothetical protein